MFQRYVLTPLFMGHPSYGYDGAFIMTNKNQGAGLSEPSRRDVAGSAAGADRRKQGDSGF